MKRLSRIKINTEQLIKDIKNMHSDKNIDYCMNGDIEILKYADNYEVRLLHDDFVLCLLIDESNYLNLFNLIMATIIGYNRAVEMQDK